MNDLSSRLTPINNEYPTCDETEATLAIYDIDPDLITQKLKIKPTYNQKQGVPNAKRTGVSRIANRSSWLYSTKESNVLSKDLRVHLNWLLDAIEPNALQLLEIQQFSGAKMTIRCKWVSKYGDGGPTFWPEHGENGKTKLGMYIKLRILWLWPSGGRLTLLVS